MVENASGPSGDELDALDKSQVRSGAARLRTDSTMDDVLALALSWEEAARRRKDIAEGDPVAQALAYCARELVTLLDHMGFEARFLTAAEYARLYDVSPQSVTRWIRTGRLDAVRARIGYLIDRNARPLLTGRVGATGRRPKWLDALDKD